MDHIHTGQVQHHAAAVYEEFFVPALFAEWAPRLLEMAAIQTDQRVLDVACGTGVLAREVAKRRRTTAGITGLDLNGGMLAVARQKAPTIDWRHGRAEELPFPSQSFDAVISQFGLMFFDDRRAAVREMARVTKPGGRLAVAVWDSLASTPGYAAVATLLDRLFGAEIAAALHAPFVLGDKADLTPLFELDRLTQVRIETRSGTARFPSIRDWMFTDVNGWTLAGMLDEDQYETLVTAAEKELQQFVGTDGQVRFPSPAHIVTAVVR